MTDLKLKDVLGVCAPDWIVVGGKFINVNKKGIPEELLDTPIKEITGFDDGLTIELECLPKQKEKEYTHE